MSNQEMTMREILLGNPSPAAASCARHREASRRLNGLGCYGQVIPSTILKDEEAAFPCTCVRENEGEDNASSRD